jgi:CDP-diacylglycerol---serine O-phosphatidyltransferase
VLAHRHAPGSSSFFVGLPIPLAAGMLISLVIANHLAHADAPVEAHGAIAVVVAALSLLMVSTIRYRTFKDARLSKTSALVFMGVCLLGVIVAVQLRPAYVLIAYFSAYLIMGLAEHVLFFKKRRVEAKAAAAAVAVAEEEEELEEEEEDEGAEPVQEEEFI